MRLSLLPKNQAQRIREYTLFKSAPFRRKDIILRSVLEAEDEVLGTVGKIDDFGKLKYVQTINTSMNIVRGHRLLAETKVHCCEYHRALKPEKTYIFVVLMCRQGVHCARMKYGQHYTKKVWYIGKYIHLLSGMRRMINWHLP